MPGRVLLSPRSVTGRPVPGPGIARLYGLCPGGEGGPLRMALVFGLPPGRGGETG